MSPHLLVCTFLSKSRRSSSLRRTLLELDYKVLIVPDVDCVARSASSIAPDIVIMDLGSDPTEVAATLGVVDILHQRQVMSLVLAPRSISVPLLSEIMRCGASEVLAAHLPISAIVECIEELSRRRRGPLAPYGGSDTVYRLTSRERLVASLVVQGLDNKRMGARLGLSYRTIEVYRRHLLDKLGVSCTGELFRLSTHFPGFGWADEP